jgi:hypothetical protein
MVGETIFTVITDHHKYHYFFNCLSSELFVAASQYSTVLSSLFNFSFRVANLYRIVKSKLLRKFVIFKMLS